MHVRPRPGAVPIVTGGSPLCQGLIGGAREEVACAPACQQPHALYCTVRYRLNTQPAVLPHLPLQIQLTGRTSPTKMQHLAAKNFGGNESSDSAFYILCRIQFLGTRHDAVTVPGVD